MLFNTPEWSLNCIVKCKWLRRNSKLLLRSATRQPQHILTGNFNSLRTSKNQIFSNNWQHNNTCRNFFVESTGCFKEKQSFPRCTHNLDVSAGQSSKKAAVAFLIQLIPRVLSSRRVHVQAEGHSWALEPLLMKIAPMKTKTTTPAIAVESALSSCCLQFCVITLTSLHTYSTIRHHVEFPMPRKEGYSLYSSTQPARHSLGS